MVISTDRIEKNVRLKATQERVWRAISDVKEFGSWFGVELDGPFAPGASLRGHWTATQADDDVAKMMETYRGTPAAFFVEKVEPIRYLSYKWHPFAVDRDYDYSQEPMTHVSFTLEAAGSDTHLRIVESGFDSVPQHRRVAAFEANEEGWGMMVDLIGKHLQQHPS